MSRGRRPIPTSQKILEGNPGKRPLNFDEPESRALQKMPPAPRWLNDDAKDAWRIEGKRFIRAGVLTELDLTAFTMWCIWWSRAAQAERELNKRKENGELAEPMVRRGMKGNTYINPWMNVLSMAQKAMMKIEVEFGKTPASRSKVKMADARQRGLFEDPDLDGDDDSPESGAPMLN